MSACQMQKNKWEDVEAGGQVDLMRSGANQK